MRYLIGLENHVTVQIKRYISHGINVIQLYSPSSEILKCFYQSMKKSTSAYNGYKSKWFNIYDSNSERKERLEHMISNSHDVVAFEKSKNY